MKKFTLVAPGECFEFQGEQYSKSGPLTAINLATNRQRMIPRSAVVKPLNSNNATEPATQTESVQLDSAATLAAFERYHTGCLEWFGLAEKELSEETATKIRLALQQAHDRFITDLQPPQ